jgi:hypothetical protein
MHLNGVFGGIEIEAINIQFTLTVILSLKPIYLRGKNYGFRDVVGYIIVGTKRSRDLPVGLYC